LFCIVQGMATPFAIGKSYTRDQIADVVNGNTVWYLPISGGQVVAVCLRPDHNPNAPTVVLCGSGPMVEKTGELLAAETKSLPVFVKEATNAWTYCGRFKVVSSCTRGSNFKRAIAGHPSPSSITRVVFLERVRA
jgi:hypothetical protein